MKTLSRRTALKGLALGAAASWGPPFALSEETGESPSGASKELPAVDVLVCGGGPAGIAAALMSARQGARTLLVERYGRIGGMAVQGMVGPLLGRVRSKQVDEIVKYIGGRRVDYEFLDLKYSDLLQAAGCEILLHSWITEPLTDGNRVTGARFFSKEGMMDVKARVTIDATGDGDVAFGAGAEFDQGRGDGTNWKADGLVQPMTIMFRVAGVNHAESMCAHGGWRTYRFPDGRSWRQITKDANSRGELPKTVGTVRIDTSWRDDERVINATQVNYVDGTKVVDLTKAELEGRRQVQAIVAFLRKNAPGFQNAYVNGMPAVIGVRETRRIRGIEALSVEDLIVGRKWPNAVVRGASFGIDIHNPDGIGQAEDVSDRHPLGKARSVKPYDIPYGCLVPREVDGLLTAGRCISGTHEAMASYRVQIIAMGTGVAAGVAAACAVKRRIGPREVPVEDIQRVVLS